MPVTTRNQQKCVYAEENKFGRKNVKLLEKSNDTLTRETNVKLLEKIKNSFPSNRGLSKMTNILTGAQKNNDIDWKEMLYLVTLTDLVNSVKTLIYDNEMAVGTKNKMTTCLKVFNKINILLPILLNNIVENEYCLKESFQVIKLAAVVYNKANNMRILTTT